PSSVVNVITALSNVRRDVYLYILLAAKFIMILSMTLVGYDIASFFDSPMKLILSLVFLCVLYLLSKWYQKYLEKKINKEKKKKYEVASLAKEIREWIVSILIALSVVILVRMFLFTTYSVDGLSMDPTLEDGDRVIVNKFIYDISDIDRDDVIVFDSHQ